MSKTSVSCSDMKTGSDRDKRSGVKSLTLFGIVFSKNGLISVDIEPSKLSATLLAKKGPRSATIACETLFVRLAVNASTAKLLTLNAEVAQVASLCSRGVC